MWSFLLAALWLWHLANTQYPPEFLQLVALVPGLYDNRAQYEDDIARGLPANLRHARLTTSLVPENVSFLSARKNFYWEQWLGGQTGRVVGQALYSFGISPYTLAMDLKRYTFNNPSVFLHAKAYDPVFLSLSERNVTYLQGCDEFWYQQDSSAVPVFTSWMYRTCCRTLNGSRVALVDTHNVTKAYLTAYEQHYLGNGTVLWRDPSPYNMTRQTADTDTPTK